MFVIQRTDQGGGYVAKPGSASAYTHDLRKAKIFPDEASAERDRCEGNEIIVALHTLLRV